jgi:hypothetical protein
LTDNIYRCPLAKIISGGRVIGLPFRFDEAAQRTYLILGFISAFAQVQFTQAG